jgi:hypothetical protein
MEKHKKKSAVRTGGKSAKSATVRDLDVADRDQEKVKAGSKAGGERKPPIKY